MKNLAPHKCHFSCTARETHNLGIRNRSEKIWAGASGPARHQRLDEKCRLERGAILAEPSDHLHAKR